MENFKMVAIHTGVDGLSKFATRLCRATLRETAKNSRASSRTLQAPVSMLKVHDVLLEKD